MRLFSQGVKIKLKIVYNGVYKRAINTQAKLQYSKQGAPR